MALHDPLTGLPTRRLFMERAREMLRLADRRQTSVALVAWRPGEPPGGTGGDRSDRDRRLVETARRLRDGLRATDLVGRTAEREFVLLLTGLEGEAGLREALERLVDASRRSAGAGGGREGRAGARHRAGAALYPEHGARAGELLERAREALEDSIRDEASFRLYRRSSEDRAPGEEAAIPDADALAASVRGGDLRLVYQPVARLSDRSTEGLEALLRLPAEGGGMLPARRVVPALREHGLAVEADHAVLETAVDTFARWPEGRRPAWLSVNLTVETAVGDGFARRLGALLEESDVEPRRLVIELAAADARDEPGAVREAMGRVRGAGARIALDDVGAGPLPLAPLGERPLHFLKLDPEAIRGLDAEDSRLALVEALVGLGHALGARVVAEGVETEAELRRLAGAGCDLAQGFHLGEPRAAEGR